MLSLPPLKYRFPEALPLSLPVLTLKSAWAKTATQRRESEECRKMSVLNVFLRDLLNSSTSPCLETKDKSKENSFANVHIPSGTSYFSEKKL